ncbi:MAG: hypothetical protein C3F02_01585 [Parcubacteria group bacterium]|nr:MAG: hypothetical protein C3F02_01585 [Parcubacteria group bacterium]
MDPYLEFDAFLQRLSLRLGQAVDDELDRLRQDDPVRWMEQAEIFRLLVAPFPSYGPLNHEVRAVNTALDYLYTTHANLLPRILGLILSQANQHYRSHLTQLTALTKEHTLHGVSSGSLVQDLLDHLREGGLPPEKPAE